MDPDACLAALLDAFRTGDRQEAFDRIEALSDWMASSEGFLPKDPREQPKGIVLSRSERLTISSALFLLLRHQTKRLDFSLSPRAIHVIRGATAIIELGQRIIDEYPDDEPGEDTGSH